MSISNKLGSSCYLIVAIAMVVLQPSVALNAKAANEVCNLLMDGISIFSGSSCSHYYSCMSGLATLVACDAGYYFSRDSQACELASLVACTTDDSPCANIPTGRFVSVPNSCTSYYYCNNGVAEMGNCPSGLNFDQPNQSCNYTSDYPCNTDSLTDSSESINYCSYVPNGHFFGSSSACDGWQECKSTGLVTGVCPSPYLFNVETASCDYESNVSCRQTNGVATTTTGSLTGTSCSTNGVTVSDGQTCTGFYTCTNNAYVYNTCVGGLYFNPSSGSCVNRVEAINNCNRCEDTTLQFVNLYQDNCVGYASCSSGRMASKGTCSSGYFNENLAACVVGGTEPLFPVCNVEMAASENTTTTTVSTTTNSTASTSSNSTDTTTVTTTVAGSTNSTATTTVSTTVAGSTNSTATTTVSTTLASSTTLVASNTTDASTNSTTTVDTTTPVSNTTLAAGTNTTAAV